MNSISPLENPLSGAARFGLVCGAGTTILVFYLFSIGAILLLSAVLAFELVLVIVAARFGMVRIMTRVMERHLGLARVFIRSFRLRKGVEFRFSLPPEDAPRLFSILERLCQRLNVALPREVSIEMGFNAWVRLKGYRRGAGKTILGIGYDLLAGLSEAEMEGILAHEMVHAKLIQRGFRSWLHGGLARLVSLAGALAAQAQTYRRAKITSSSTEFFLRIADWLARLATGLVATYSRQDEFDADRGAAELCGSDTVRSAFLKLDPLAEKTSRLPWRDRVAQLQLAEGFSQWLVKELSLEQSSQSREHSQVFNKYSTHPSLRDRLAALPVSGASETPQNFRSAIELLAQPDAVATKLIEEIQRVLADEEQKDSKELRRWTRKQRRSSHIRPLGFLGFLMIAGGIVSSLIALFASKSFIGTTISIALVVSGVFVYRRSKYKDRLELPMPDFALLKKWKLENLKDVESVQKQIEAELNGLIANERKRRKKVLLLTSESYAALAQCNYLKAHVAARLCHGLDKKSVEALLSLSVAAAALHLTEQSAWALNAAQRITALKSPSTIWGAAWSLLLAGDWGRAEAFLDEAAKHRPENSTVLILLSIAQSQRGKSQSAILSARQACTPQPKNKEHAKLLINLLLDAGHWREAKERLLPLESQVHDDAELMLAFVRLCLTQKDFEAAEKWTELLDAQSSESDHLVPLGHAYTNVRKNEKAAHFYRRALDVGFYPEAFLGLGRLEAHSRNKEEARRHFLASLNINLPVGKGGASSLSLFHTVVAELLFLEEPASNCRAWVGSFSENAAVPALANQSFMTYAVSQQEAEQYVQTILSAMQPNVPPPLMASVQWRKGLPDQQPIGPVRPGVQFLLH